MNSQSFVPPFKSVAVALLFSVLLGPIGLLYSSYWGGFFMIFAAILVASVKYPFPMLLTWIVCSIWAVGAVEKYNQKLLQMSAALKKENP